MKTLLLIGILLINSCGAEKAAWDSLSVAEQANLRERARVQCMAESANPTATFKSRSAEFFYENTYEAGAQFNWTYKGTSGGTATSSQTANILVWARTLNTDVYLLVTDPTEQSGSYFVKITAAQNDIMIDDLVEDYCSKIYDNGSISSGGMSITNLYDHLNGQDTRKFNDTFTLNFDDLAFFAKYNLSKTVTTYNVNGSNTKTEEFVSTFGLGSKLTPPFIDSTTGTTNKYCVPKVDPASSQYRLRSVNKLDSELGFLLDCVAVKPGDWTI